MCDHLEVNNFGTFLIRPNGKEGIVTLGECVSCKEYLTLDSKIIPRSAIKSRVDSAKENMRTMTAQINSDIYDRIFELTERERVSNEPSKIINELLSLGLHHYSRLHESGVKVSKVRSSP